MVVRIDSLQANETPSGVVAVVTRHQWPVASRCRNRRPVASRWWKVSIRVKSLAVRGAVARSPPMRGSTRPWPDQMTSSAGEAGSSGLGSVSLAISAACMVSASWDSSCRG